MEPNNPSPLRRMLEQQSTEVLQEMLEQQLGTDPVNTESVRMILSILRSRAPAPRPEVTGEAAEAMERYRALVARQDRQQLRRKKGKKLLIRALSTAAVLALILAVILPQQAEAGSIWKRLTRWTEEVIVEFFTPNDNDHRLVEYEFTTDHPGLQEVYDAVVEMGITQPVVPMWLPEGSELLECKLSTARSRDQLFSRFLYKDSEITFVIDKYAANVLHQFEKNNSEALQFEKQNTTFFIIQNNEIWTVIWCQDNIECSLAIDCQEDVLYRILNSIYTPEA